MIMLYDLNKGAKIYIEDKVIIFDHLDGMYSYCYDQKDKSKLLHLSVMTPLEKFKDGFKIKEQQ